MLKVQEDRSITESGLEQIISEEEDLDSSPANYDIVTYPADFTIEGLVQKYQRGQLKIPGFQRKFVWKLPQASKLIESFLLGLPVPAIFLYTDPQDNSFLVIDGQQRLMSIVYFFEGYFGPEEQGKRTVFALKGLHEESSYLSKTYADLEQTDEATLNKLNDSVLRAFVVKQLKPEDNTSIYHIFERLNTGGTQLVSQEIRNCIYHGPFNDLLGELNENPDWRSIFGGKQEDKRQRDIELILRFIALSYDSENYEKPMKDFLSQFLNKHRSSSKEELKKYSSTFKRTVKLIKAHLGDKPFHIRAGLNVAVFDSVSVAFSKHLAAIPNDVSEKYDKLTKDEDFLESVSSATTDKEVVSKRLSTAHEQLFG